MSIEQQGAGTNEPMTAGMAGRVRATSAMARATLPVEQPDRALVTAELPVVSPRSSRGLPTSRYADPARRRGGIIKRDPAPAALRVIVWFLFFVFLFSAASVVVAELHPTWLATLRNEIPTLPKSKPQPPAHPVAQSTTISVVSSSPTLVNYSVPATSFSIIVETAGRCWTVLHTPINSPAPQFEATLPPATTKRFTVRSTASLVTDASVRAIRVVSGGHNLGSVATPKVAVKYTFTAANS